MVLFCSKYDTWYNDRPNFIIPAYGTYVVCDNDANAAMLAVADQTSTSSFFNGDDAVALIEDGIIRDIIGQIGFDPGSQWGTGLVSTADNTIRRKSTVTMGIVTALMHSILPSNGMALRKMSATDLAAIPAIAPLLLHVQ